MITYIRPGRACMAPNISRTGSKIDPSEGRTLWTYYKGGKQKNIFFGVLLSCSGERFPTIMCCGIPRSR